MHNVICSSLTHFKAYVVHKYPETKLSKYQTLKITLYNSHFKGSSLFFFFFNRIATQGSRKDMVMNMPSKDA